MNLMSLNRNVHNIHVYIHKLYNAQIIQIQLYLNLLFLCSNDSHIHWQPTAIRKLLPNSTKPKVFSKCSGLESQPEVATSFIITCKTCGNQQHQQQDKGVLSMDMQYQLKLS